jgi:hypothetical protein
LSYSSIDGWILQQFLEYYIFRLVVEKNSTMAIMTDLKYAARKADGWINKSQTEKVIIVGVSASSSSLLRIHLHMYMSYTVADTTC